MRSATAVVALAAASSCPRPPAAGRRRLVRSKRSAAPGLPLAGLVSLSGETQIAGADLDGLAAVPRLRSPLLIVGSRDDRYLSVPDALRLLRRAGSRDKRTAFYPGAFHGWDLVEDAPYAARVRKLVLAWIRAR